MLASSPRKWVPVSLACLSSFACVAVVSLCALGIAERGLSPWLLPAFLVGVGACGVGVRSAHGARRWLCGLACLAVVVAAAYTYALASYRGLDECISRVGAPVDVTFDPVRARVECSAPAFMGQPPRGATVPLGELLSWPVYLFR